MLVESRLSRQRSAVALRVRHTTVANPIRGHYVLNSLPSTRQQYVPSEQGWHKKHSGLMATTVLHSDCGTLTSTYKAGNLTSLLLSLARAAGTEGRATLGGIGSWGRGSRLLALALALGRRAFSSTRGSGYRWCSRQLWLVGSSFSNCE